MMEKVLTVDAALAILTKAKEQMGGEAALILCLTSSLITDCNVNDMVIQHDTDNAYVEVLAKHPELAHEKWLIYQDSTRNLYDAIEDDPPSNAPVGMNWAVADYGTALRFVSNMSKAEGWTRGHWHQPR